MTMISEKAVHKAVQLDKLTVDGQGFGEHPRDVACCVEVVEDEEEDPAPQNGAELRADPQHGVCFTLC